MTLVTNDRLITRWFATCTFLFFCSISVLADEVSVFDLVLLEEYQEAQAAGDNPDHDLMPKSPGGPVISVVSPVVSQGSLIESPVDIEVKFESGSDSEIEMTSLKIYYLMFIKKDVTERLLQHAEVGVDYIRATGAKLPTGKHKFLVEIEDSKNRRSAKKFVVNVRS